MQHLSAICFSLADALFIDPFYQTVTLDYAHDAAQRRNRLARYCQLAIDEAIAAGEVQICAPYGAAIWQTDDASPAQRQKASEKRTQALAKLLGPLGFTHYVAIGDNMTHNLPDDLATAWYLSILGIRPSEQRKGLGAKLLSTTLQRADTCAKRCYLDTFTPLNMPFYQHLGFEPVKLCHEAVTGADYWIMVREPRTALKPSL